MFCSKSPQLVFLNNMNITCRESVEEGICEIKAALEVVLKENIAQKQTIAELDRDNLRNNWLTLERERHMNVILDGVDIANITANQTDMKMKVISRIYNKVMSLQINDADIKYVVKFPTQATAKVTPAKNQSQYSEM